MNKENIGYRNTGDYNIGDSNIGNCNIGDMNTGICNNGNSNNGNSNIGDWNAGICNTGICNTGDFNIGDRNTGDKNTGNRNIGNRNIGICNTGNFNIGDNNIGDSNIGIFNTDEPNMRAFNKETNIKYSDYKNSNNYIYFDLPINEYVFYSNMTEEEKSKCNYAKITGGFIRTLTYKEAWSKWWEDNRSEEMIDKIKNLPNFNEEIWEEITGIQLEEANNEVEKAIKLLEEKGLVVTGKILK